MSKGYFLLSILMAAIVCLHVFAGGPEYADQFKEIMLDSDLRAMSLVLWHAVTTSLIAISLTYMWLAFHHSRELFVLTSGLQFAWGALFLFYGATILGEFSTQPQWVLFVACPLFAAWIEFSRSPKQSN